MIIKSNAIIIFGSYRKAGNTRNLIEDIFKGTNVDLLDLNEYEIKPYDYQHNNTDDQFIEVIEHLLQYDTWIIATPVYWSNMSLQHKIFFDRFTDLLQIRKDLGRKLEGKNIYLIGTFSSHHGDALEILIKDISYYFKMNYQGCQFFYNGRNTDLLEQDQKKIEEFREKFSAGRLTGKE